MFTIKNLLNDDFVFDEQGYRYLFTSYRDADKIARRWNRTEENGNVFVVRKILPTIKEILHYDAVTLRII